MIHIKAPCKENEWESSYHKLFVFLWVWLCARIRHLINPYNKEESIWNDAQIHWVKISENTGRPKKISTDISC